MKIVKNVRKAAEICSRLRIENTIGFVPTMGALHAAHEELIRTAKRENESVVVSVFVNPKQFGPKEDYKLYPRTLEKDIRLCSKLGVRVFFNPGVNGMYGRQYNTYVEPAGSISENMCAKSRSGHFSGVATVVAKLLNIIRPHRVYLGQKDYQQYKIIERMVIDLNYNIQTVMCPTVREKDGLAISSRNKYLTVKQRKSAPVIFRALKKGVSLVNSGEKNPMQVCKIMENLIKRELQNCRIDYLGIFNADNLKESKKLSGDIILAAAIWVGKARLIDNILINVS